MAGIELRVTGAGVGGQVRERRAETCSRSAAVDIHKSHN